MNITEIFDSEDIEGFRTEKDDKSVPTLNDVRKTKLTLAQLNRLRIMSDVRSLEHEQHIDKVQSQYKSPPEEGGGMM
jgi:hypothetical protein